MGAVNIPEVDPSTAAARLRDEPGSVYLDVRSTIEYDEGHAKGAWNIPILHATAAGMRPNSEFQEVASATLPKDTLIVVGCKSGQRSFVACRTLLGMGFTRVANMAGGFGGAIDPLTHRVVTPGWRDSGLPTTTDPTPGKTWDELRAVAKSR
jgi:rhodanese-related sulfurtransferase